MSKSTISTLELFQRFPDQDSARVFIESKRWAESDIKCPHCKSHKISKFEGKRVGYARCQKFRKEFTERTGTILERSYIPLHEWILGIYLVVISREALSSMQLAKEIGITQKSAWFMLQRIRAACPSNDDFLDGIENVWAVLKRGFHHFSKKQIDRYVDEFVFRRNESNVKKRGAV